MREGNKRWDGRVRTLRCNGSGGYFWGIVWVERMDGCEGKKVRLRSRRIKDWVYGGSLQVDSSSIRRHGDAKSG